MHEIQETSIKIPLGKHGKFSFKDRKGSIFQHPPWLSPSPPPNNYFLCDSIVFHKLCEKSATRFN